MDILIQISIIESVSTKALSQECVKSYQLHQVEDTVSNLHVYCYPGYNDMFNIQYFIS